MSTVTDDITSDSALFHVQKPIIHKSGIQN